MRRDYDDYSEGFDDVYPGRYVGDMPDWRSSGSVRRKRSMIEGFENLISMLDYVMSSKKKRHIVGGVLLSVSMLFGGLAITAMTVKTEEDNQDEDT